MGVRRYYKRWRCYAVDKKGKQHQEYFDTEAQAQDRYDELVKGKLRLSNYKKRSGAKHPRMPVGVHEHNYTKLNVYGEIKHYKSIKGTVCINGKVATCQRSYGKLRTRKEAIRMCENWRIVMLKEAQRKHKILSTKEALK